MKSSIIGLLVTGLVAALSVGLLLALYLSGGPQSAQAKPHDPDVSVLVAREDVGRFTQITHEMLDVIKVPASAAEAGALREPTQAVGKVLVTDVKAGQVFTRGSFAEGASGPNIVGRLKPGMRAVSVPLSEYAGLESLLYPGSLVDVVATFRVRLPGGEDAQAVATTLLQGVRVLGIEDHLVESEEGVAAGARGADGQTQVPRARRRMNVTLEVSVEQAKDLQLAMEHGTLSLTMRNPLDQAEVATDATVLSSGQMAKLATVLQAHRQAEEPPSALAVPTVEKEPLQPRSWDVQVFRGTKRESQSLPLDEQP